MMDWRQLLSAQRLGHKGAEPVTPSRNPFQKDWDRVVFSSAFRRLQDKTQVHSLSDNDYVRTRLTHSLEVSSVGRSLGAMIGETIVARQAMSGISAAEFGHIVAAACLAHDIGNPPFGHFGEATIRHWFADAAGGAAFLAPLSAAQRQDFLRFEGNAQGFRILSRLQNWRNAGGLRLTCATLGTFAKYPHDSQFGEGRIEGDDFAAPGKEFRRPALVRVHVGQRVAKNPLVPLAQRGKDEGVGRRAVENEKDLAVFFKHGGEEFFRAQRFGVVAVARDVARIDGAQRRQRFRTDAGGVVTREFEVGRILHVIWCLASQNSAVS